MLVDLHVHTSFSEGYAVDVEEAVRRCRLGGIDAIVLTECDVIPDPDAVKEVSERLGFPIFVGVDIDTTRGRLVGIPPDPWDERFLWVGEDEDSVTPERVLAAFEEIGGVIIAAHPYVDDGGPVFGDGIVDVEGLAAVEVVCGVQDELANDLALEAVAGMGLRVVGGSDSSEDGERLGRFATAFLEPIGTQAELVEAIREGFCWPVRVDPIGSARKRRRRRRGGAQGGDDTDASDAPEEEDR